MMSFGAYKVQDYDSSLKSQRGIRFRHVRQCLWEVEEFTVHAFHLHRWARCKRDSRLGTHNNQTGNMKPGCYTLPSPTAPEKLFPPLKTTSAMPSTHKHILSSPKRAVPQYRNLLTCIYSSDAYHTRVDKVSEKEKDNRTTFQLICNIYFVS